MSSLYWKDITYLSNYVEKFDTKEELDSYVEKTKSALSLGQMFIVGTNVYVWDNEKLIQSSGEEVDLSDYVTKSGNETLHNKSIVGSTIQSTGDENLVFQGENVWLNDDGLQYAKFHLSRNTQETAIKSLYFPYFNNYNTALISSRGAQKLYNKTIIDAIIDSPNIEEIKNGENSIIVPARSGTIALNADVIAAENRAKDAQTAVATLIDTVDELTNMDLLTADNTATIHNKVIDCSNCFLRIPRDTYIQSTSHLKEEIM